MTKDQFDNDDAADFPSAKEMRGWLVREKQDIERAAALRIRDAEDCVRAYEQGLSQAEAAQRFYDYSVRWGDVIKGSARTEGLTDEQLLDRLDAVHREREEARLKRGVYPDRSR